MGVETGVSFGREGGSASGKEAPAVCKGWSCVFRGPEDCRRVFVVRGGTAVEGGSGGKRTESREAALREPFGGVGVDGF